MSLRKSVTMMSNTGNAYNLVGDKIRADSYFGYTDGIHTVQVVYQNFTGGIGIQGTLALDPSDEDWFWIQLVDSRGNCSDRPYMVYPKDPLNPTGAAAQASTGLTNSNGDSGTEAFTFQGNFVYLRAIVTREYIQPPPTPNIDGRWYLGQVDRILVSL